MMYFLLIHTIHFVPNSVLNIWYTVNYVIFGYIMVFLTLVQVARHFYLCNPQQYKRSDET